MTHGVIEIVPEAPPCAIRRVDNFDQYNTEGRRFVRLFIDERRIHVEITLGGGLDGRSVQSSEQRFSLMIALLPQAGEQEGCPEEYFCNRPPVS